MPRTITRKDFVERLHNLPRESYALIANVAKGIALGAGGYVLVQIFSNLHSEWMRLLPWVASIELIVISYGKWSRGALFVNARTNAWDNILPMLMGVAEFLLFAVLNIDSQPNNHSNIWLNWSACVAFHSFLGLAIVQNRLHFLDMPGDFDTSLADLVNTYREWSKRDRLQTALVGSAALAVWIGEHVVASYAVWIQMAFAAVFVIGAWKPISDSNRQQNQIDAYVSHTEEDAAKTHSTHEEKPVGGSLAGRAMKNLILKICFVWAIFAIMTFFAGWFSAKHFVSRVAIQTARRFVAPHPKASANAAFNVGVECPSDYDMKFIELTPTEEKEFERKAGDDVIDEVAAQEKRTNKLLNNGVCVQKMP